MPNSPTICEVNAQVELQHIKLELDSGRLQHMRHFVDQYYCYCMGGDHVTSSGRANWDHIWFTAVRSSAARELGQNRKSLVKEHVVPLKVVGQILEAQNRRHPLSLCDIGKILKRLTLFAIITKEEDKKLRQARLTSTMPLNALPDYPFFEDRLARYKHVGIAIETSIDAAV